MRADRRLLLPALFLLAACAPAFGQSRGIEVIPAGGLALSVSPGSLVTRLLLVSNTSLPRQDFRETLEVPDGWRVVSGGGSFTVGIKGGDTRIVSFVVPRKAPPATYTVAYRITGSGEPPVEAGVRFSITVLPVRKVSVTLVDAPAFVLAGEAYTASFRVLNTGNLPVAVLCGASSGDGLPFELDAARFRLEPDESRIVLARVRTPADLSRSLKHLLRLSAAPEKDALRPQTVSSLVTVLPFVTGKEDPFHRLPMTLALTQVLDHGVDNTFGLMAELTGGGTLDGEGRKRVEFSLRAPITSDPSLFTEPAAFSLDYRADPFSLFLGDRFYSLSALTEPSVYGRGVQAGVDIGSLSLGSYYLLAAPGFPTEELSAYADWHLDADQTLGVNSLMKNGDPLGSLFSVEGSLRPTRSSGLDFEVSSGLGLADDQAFLLDLSGSRPGVAYQLKAVHAGSRFGGGIRDTNLVSAALALPFSRGLVLSASLGARENDLSSPTPFRQEVLGCGLRWRTGGGNDLSVTWGKVRQNLPPAEPWMGDRQKSIQFHAARVINRLKLDAGVWFGRVTDPAGPRVQERYSTSVAYRLDSRQSVGASLGVESPDSAEPSGLVTVLGLSAAVEVLPRTILQVQYRSADRRSSFYGGRDSLNAGLTYRFPNEAELGFQGLYSPDRAADRPMDYRLLLTFRSPLSLELNRNNAQGRIAGRVYDEESGRGVPGVVLRLEGAVAVSDESGKFLFHSLKPGVHHLFADTGRIGLDRIVTAGQPVAVAVKGDAEETVELAIARAASLSGKVVLYRSAGGALGEAENLREELEPGESLPNLLVRISREGETLQTVTDRGGIFQFSKIRPGEWAVKVLGEAMPENTTLQNPAFTVTLGPGEDRLVEVRALPQKRAIRMMDGGAVETE